MARKRIALRQFQVFSYDDATMLDHKYRECDWMTDANGMTPLEVTQAAREHARECDGKPQPRPVRPASAGSSLLPAAWIEQLGDALRTSVIRRAG